jgi:hypothetical protein
MLHIDDMVAFYHPGLWGFENIGRFSGGFCIILHGGSYKCITFKIVTGIIHNYHTDKLATGNNI